MAPSPMRPLLALAAAASALRPAAALPATGQVLAQVREHKAALEADGERLENASRNYWPLVRGRVGAYGTTSLQGPEQLTNSTLSWSWHHPGGRYHSTMLGGALLDSQKNIVVSMEHGIFKLSPAGDVLWNYTANTPFSNVPCLMDDAVYGNSMSGWLFKLSLETGEELWAQKYDSVSMDTAYVQAHAGVVVSGHSRALGEGNLKVMGLNATDGSKLWDYEPPTRVWNVMAMFPDDDTAVFMDIHGGVNRVGLHNGTRIWYTPSPDGIAGTTSFSDGGLILGPDGDVYTCSNPKFTLGQEGQAGKLRKFALADGSLQWDVTLQYPCNSWPAVSADNSYVVVVPGSFNGNAPTMDAMTLHAIPSDNASVQEYHERMLQLGEGQREHFNLPKLRAAIAAFDTATGEQLWWHDVEPWGKVASDGDEEGFLERAALGIRAECLPAHWSSPTIDAGGAIYVGRTSGELYRYDPRAGSGESTYYTGAGPLHSGTTFAPGMMAYTDCDSLYVFRAPQ